jgi:hypothetical protein
VFLSLLILVPVFSQASTKKLQVCTPSAQIHLDPEAESPVIAVLDQGDFVSQASDRLFRNAWLYIYFKSHGSSALKSGYIHRDSVIKLFRATRVITIEDNRGSGPKDPVSPGLRWGMPSSEIQRRVGRPASLENHEGNTVLHYRGHALERPCLIGYVFADDRLASTRYHFETGNRHLAEYGNLKTKLEERYGRPVEDLAVWKDNRYRENSGLWDRAVDLGELACSTFWRTEFSDIRLNLNRGQAGVNLLVEISDRDFKGTASQ